VDRTLICKVVGCSLRILGFPALVAFMSGCCLDTGSFTRTCVSVSEGMLCTFWCEGVVTADGDSFACGIGSAVLFCEKIRRSVRLHVIWVGAPYVLLIPASLWNEWVLLTLRIVSGGVVCTLASELSGCSLRTVLYTVYITFVFEMFGCSLRNALNAVFFMQWS
jgi:hypothetical protein